MKKPIIALVLILIMSVSLMPSAFAVSVTVGDKPVLNAKMYNSTTYVPLRAVAKVLCPGASIYWDNANNRAVVHTTKLTLTARPGNYYINANGRMLYVKDGVKILNGSVMVPVRVLAKATGALVTWNGSKNAVYVKRGSGTILPGEEYYNTDSLYWLSRIINAESIGEPLKGKIAVGNVILNRVNSPDFPNSIHDVIFDDRGGVQFEPVSNGSIYNTPSEDSILAAKLCLDGASVVGNSLFFLNPAKSSNHWAIRNCDYIATIGRHQFYV